MFRTRAPLLSLLLLGLSACSSDDPPDAPPPDLPPRAVRLTLETPASVILGLAEQRRLVARVTWDDTGEPASGRTVAFAIAGATGGATLAAERVSSDGGGHAIAGLTAGASGSAAFDVVVTTAQAAGAGADPRVTVAVQVDGSYHGKLEVRYALDRPVAVGAVSTRVDRGGSCDDVPWPSQPPGEASLVARGLGDVTTFTGLVEGEAYRVTALATGVAGQPVATGCALAPRIVGRGTVAATLELRPLPPVLVGTYELGTDLHLASTLPPEVARVVDVVTRGVTDPAGYLADELTRRLAAALGVPEPTVLLALEGAWALLACTGTAPCRLDADGDGRFLDDALFALLFDGLYRRWPVLADGALAGADLATLFRDLRVGGTLAVETVDAEGKLTARWSWTDFLLRWRLGSDCDPRSACCGRRVHSTDVLGAGARPATLTGTLTPRDASDHLAWDLVIPPQAIELPLAELLGFILMRQLLPSITRPDITSLGCAVESWMGCAADDAHYVCCDGAGSCRPTSPDGLAAGDRCGCERAGQVLHDALAGSLGPLAPSAGGFATLCRLGLGELQTAGLALLYQLEQGRFAGDHLTLAVNGVLSDVDRDLQGDHLEASTQGRMVWTGAAPGDAFTGTLVADRQRRRCEADHDCQSFEVCRPELDAVDDCAVRQVCALRAGPVAGGETCATGAQCATGLCTPERRCLQLCHEAADCAAPLTCEPGVVVGLAPVGTASGSSVSVSACR